MEVGSIRTRNKTNSPSAGVRRCNRAIPLTISDWKVQDSESKPVKQATTQPLATPEHTTPESSCVLEQKNQGDTPGHLTFTPTVITPHVPTFGQSTLAKPGAYFALANPLAFLKTTPEILSELEYPLQCASSYP